MRSQWKNNVNLSENKRSAKVRTNFCDTRYAYQSCALTHEKQCTPMIKDEIVKKEGMRKNINIAGSKGNLKEQEDKIILLG